LMERINYQFAEVVGMSGRQLRRREGCALSSGQRPSLPL